MAATTSSVARPVRSRPFTFWKAITAYQVIVVEGAVDVAHVVVEGVEALLEGEHRAAAVALAQPGRAGSSTTVVVVVVDVDVDVEVLVDVLVEVVVDGPRRSRPTSPSCRRRGREPEPRPGQSVGGHRSSLIDGRCPAPGCSPPSLLT